MPSVFAPATVAVLVVLGGVPAPAQAPHCTTDVLSVESTLVTARFCAAAGPDAGGMVVSETFASHGRRIARSITFAVVAGARTSRTIDDADLSPIGIPRTLHMTLALRGGTVTLEHALALPGAIPVK